MEFRFIVEGVINNFSAVIASMFLGTADLVLVHNVDGPDVDHREQEEAEKCRLPRTKLDIPHFAFVFFQ